MMRSLWTSVSGMTAQMLNVDNITNNLANVNTHGYKAERLEFQTLLYETMRRADLDPANQTGRPVNLQVGLGVRPVATSRIFKQGQLQTTNHNMDFALQGEGFFVVRRNVDEVMFTRDGSFKYMPTGDGEYILTTSQGYHVLDENDESIIFPERVLSTAVVIDSTGQVYYNEWVVDNDYGVPMEMPIPLGQRLQILQFPNPQGLYAEGGNLFSYSDAAGEAMRPLTDEDLNRSVEIVQGYLEMSTVSVAEEMVNLITAQRAFDMNSKGITTSDEMLQTANNLKRG